MKYDIATIGHFAKDLIIVENERKWSKGGGVYYGSVILARMGFRTAMITKLASEDFELLEEVKKVGVDIYASPAPATSGIENTYFSKDMNRRKTKPIAFAGMFSRSEIPDIEWENLAIIPIIAGEVDLSLLKYLRKRTPGILALDVQGFLRVREGDNLVFRDWEEKTEGLPLVDMLKMDDAEAEVIANTKDIFAAAKYVADLGVKEVVLTHSSGLLVYANGSFYEAPWTARSLIGRTGRGDTCFSAYIGKRLTSSPAVACKFAAEVTSRKIEIPGAYYGPLPE
ncbi:MAG: PfkB family carbohydrate kinase [Candidatus Korarchaeota archaeon]